MDEATRKEISAYHDNRPDLDEEITKGETTELPADLLPIFGEEAETPKRFRTISDTEKREQNKSTTEQRVKHAGKTTILMRQARNNKDIVLLVVVAVLFTAFGYCIASIKMGMSIKDISLGVRDFIEAFLALLLGLGTLIWKIYTPPGSWSESLSRAANKPREELDESGRTIIE